MVVKWGASTIFSARTFTYLSILSLRIAFSFVFECPCWHLEVNGGKRPRHNKIDKNPYPVPCTIVLNVKRYLIYYEENCFQSLKIIL